MQYFYLYLRRLFKQELPPLKIQALYFLPLVVHLLSYIPLIFREKQSLIDSIVAMEIDSSIRIWGALALVSSSGTESLSLEELLVLLHLLPRPLLDMVARVGSVGM